VAWRAVREPRCSSSGVLARQPSCEGHHRSWFYPDMNRFHCQSPPARADGGSGRSGSPAAGLPRPGMPDGVMDLYELRSGAALLRRSLPHGSPSAVTPCRKPPPPAESGRPARSSGPAACVPAGALSASRHGSIFPFGHFYGTIRLWRNDHDAGDGRAASGASQPAGKASRSMVALLDLWPAKPFRRSFPTYSTTKVSWDDQP
jgi:hypothetical protein